MNANLEKILCKEEKELFSKMQLQCKKNNMRVRVKLNKKNYNVTKGDFCIFLYDNDKKDFLIAFNGVWGGVYFGFIDCLFQTQRFIDTYIETGKDLKKTRDILFMSKSNW